MVPSGGRAATKKIAYLSCMALIASTSCGVFSDDSLGEMMLRAERGRVEIVRDGDVIRVRREAPLETGDVIRLAGREALAKLRLEGQREAWLRTPRAGGSRAVRVADVRSLEMAGGSGGLLAEAGDPMNVVFGEVTATSSGGRFRLDQRFASSRAATYAGEVALSSPGEARVTVPRLFQASIAANELPNEVTPYELDETDDWDIAYLAGVIDLDQELEQLAGGLRNQLGRSRPTVAYFGALAGRDASFMRSYIRTRSTTNLLIGFSVASNAEVRPLPSAFERAFQLFDSFERRGRWAVVAAIMEAKASPVLAQLNRIIEGTGAVAADGGAGKAKFTVAAAEQASEGVPGRPSDDGPVLAQPTSKPSNPPTTEPTPTKRPSPTASPSPTESCGVDCIAGKVLPSSSPSPSPSSTDGDR